MLYLTFTMLILEKKNFFWNLEAICARLTRLLFVVIFNKEKWKVWVFSTMNSTNLDFPCFTQLALLS